MRASVFLRTTKMRLTAEASVSEGACGLTGCIVPTFSYLCASGLLLLNHSSAICVSFDAGCVTTALLTFDSHYFPFHKIINKEMKFI